MAKPKDLTKIIRCSARTKEGRRCKADAVPGTELCIGHTRQRKIREKKGQRIEPAKAGGTESFLHSEERASYQELLELLQKTVKADNAADSLMIERLAIASIQARRFDTIMKDFVDEKTASRNLFYADLRIMNWLKALGIDRRWRMQLKGGRGGNLEEVLKRWEHVLKGGRGGVKDGKPIIELERDDSGSETSDHTGPPEGRAGGVREGSLQNDPAREAGEIPEEPSAVQKRALGEEGGQEHS